MEIPEENNISNQLECSVCMCLFRSPVTIQCGHSFCRVCLLNSVSLKQTCPLCRKSLSHFTQRPHQDQKLTKIVEYFCKKAQEDTNSQQLYNEKLIEASQKFLLLDIRTPQLLLPYTKVVGTFQLQSPTLINKFDRFVARQESPFNKYGVIAKITFLNQLRFNVYECVIEGKYFCEIQSETVERSEELSQQFFYRNCTAKIIYEQQVDSFQNQIFQQFFLYLSKIKDKSILQNVYKVIDSHVFNSRTDKLAIYYSIMRLIAIDNQKKYETIIKFSEKQDRNKILRQFIKNIDFDVQKKPQKFLNVAQNKKVRKQFILYIISIIFIIFIIGGDYMQSEQGI